MLSLIVSSGTLLHLLVFRSKVEHILDCFSLQHIRLSSAEWVHRRQCLLRSVVTRLLYAHIPKAPGFVRWVRGVDRPIEELLLDKTHGLLRAGRRSPENRRSYALLEELLWLVVPQVFRREKIAERWTSLLAGRDICHDMAHAIRVALGLLMRSCSRVGAWQGQLNTSL